MTIGGVEMFKEMVMFAVAGYIIFYVLKEIGVLNRWLN